jgi:hypothetical protein
VHGVVELHLTRVPTASLKAREARRVLDARLADVVRQLKAARDAGDRGRVEELELEELELLEATSEPITTTEEQYRERRAARGIDDGIDMRPVSSPNVADAFHPRLERRPRSRRAPLAAVLSRRVRSRRPRSRRLAGARSSKDPPGSSDGGDEPPIARQLLGTPRMYLDAWGYLAVVWLETARRRGPRRA